MLGLPAVPSRSITIAPHTSTWLLAFLGLPASTFLGFPVANSRVFNWLPAMVRRRRSRREPKRILNERRTNVNRQNERPCTKQRMQPVVPKKGLGNRDDT